MPYEEDPSNVRTFNLYGLAVDVKQLREQKAEIVAALATGKQLTDQMHGLVSFLDAIQDQMAQITSEEFIFGDLT